MPTSMSQAVRMPLDALFRRLTGTVLLLDGDEASLQETANGLLGSDYRVVRALRTEDALAILARDPLDVIITELRLEGMTGLEFLDQARQRRPEAVRIILTGYPDVATAISAINFEEVFRYLTKPVSRDVLHATLQLAMARRWPVPPLHARDVQVAREPSWAGPRGPVLTLEEREALRETCWAEPWPALTSGGTP